VAEIILKVDGYKTCPHSDEAEIQLHIKEEDECLAIYFEYGAEDQHRLAIKFEDIFTLMAVGWVFPAGEYAEFLKSHGWQKSDS
jgi:hypothetical protein